MDRLRRAIALSFLVTISALLILPLAGCWILPGVVIGRIFGLGKSCSHNRVNHVSPPGSTKGAERLDVALQMCEDFTEKKRQFEDKARNDLSTEIERQSPSSGSAGRIGGSPQPERRLVDLRAGLLVPVEWTEGVEYTMAYGNRWFPKCMSCSSVLKGRIRYSAFEGISFENFLV